MCGIAGIYDFRKSLPVKGNDLQRMCDQIAHRGPDDEGFYFDDVHGLGLAHRRLSIIDLEAGKQPMSDANEDVWIVFNGEIYNFPELKGQLEDDGFLFRTRSDTEVIIHGYRKWGTDVVKYLNGMFAFALWDKRNELFFLARDQAGIKSLYYKLEDGKLFFGSEIRAVLAATAQKPVIDQASLNLFFRYRYTPSPRTLFKDIYKLPPGKRLIVTNRDVDIQRWWTYSPEPFDPMPSPEQASRDLQDLYGTAVKRQLISDVPLGLLLSGGVDSAMLLALMNNHGRNWPTFTVGFGSSYRDDELEDARKTAESFQARHEEIRIDRETFENHLNSIVSIVEEPIASPSIVPMFFVCKRAREDVKVAIMGQGPDELFAGYKRHLGEHYGRYWRKLPQWSRRLMQKPLTMALGRKEFVRRGLYALEEGDRLKRYQNIFSIIPGELVDSLFKENLLPEKAGDFVQESWKELMELSRHTDDLGGLNFLEIRSSLPDELLMYADKLSMAHGLEVRVPYLDYEIIEYVERLSSSFKIRRGSRKWLHKEVSRKLVPREIIKRKKRGFSVDVVDDWFRYSLSEKLDDTLLSKDSAMYEYLEFDVVNRMVREHKQGSNDYHKIIYSLIVFEEWLRGLNF